MEWFWILWAIVSVITACVAFFLAAIDVIEDDIAIVLTVYVTIFPLGIIVLICMSLAMLYDFLHKHKDKIRKFLKIKDY